MRNHSSTSKRAFISLSSDGLPRWGDSWELVKSVFLAVGLLFCAGDQLRDQMSAFLLAMWGSQLTLPVAINADRKLAFVLLEFHRAAEKLLYCKGYDVAQWYDLKKLRRDRLYAYIQNSLMWACNYDVSVSLPGFSNSVVLFSAGFCLISTSAQSTNLDAFNDH